MKEQMIKYLQEMMDQYKKEEYEFGPNERGVKKLLDKMIACKEMVEALIGEPVNLQFDGKVTVGY